MWAIAREFGIPLADLLDANPNVDPANLVVGSQICLPGIAPEPDCPGGQLYTIRAGDTFYQLSRRFNVSLDDLLAANPGVDPNRLQVGQVICIPGMAPPPKECPGILYTIRSGDTFYSLAQRYGVTVDLIIQYNPGIDPMRLQVGQVICIPTEVGPPPSPERRCLVLTVSELEAVADVEAWVLLNDVDDTVIGIMDNAPAPEELDGDATQYVLWLEDAAGDYISGAMSLVSGGLYVGRIETENPSTSFVAVEITAEPDIIGDEPGNIPVASGVIPNNM